MSEKLSTSNSEPSVIPTENIAIRNIGTPAQPDLTARHRAFLAAATSDSTRRTYRSAIRHFHA